MGVSRVPSWSSSANLRETVPGVYETAAALRRAGDYQLVFYLDAPRIVRCIDVAVASGSSRLPEGERPAIRVEPLVAKTDLSAGEPVTLTFRLTENGAAVSPEGPVAVLVFSPPWQRRTVAEAIGEGVFAVEFTIPRPRFLHCARRRTVRQHSANEGSRTDGSALSSPQARVVCSLWIGACRRWSGSRSGRFFVTDTSTTSMSTDRSRTVRPGNAQSSATRQFCSYAPPRCPADTPTNIPASARAASTAWTVPSLQGSIDTNACQSAWLCA